MIFFVYSIGLGIERKLFFIFQVRNNLYGKNIRRVIFDQDVFFKRGKHLSY